MVDFEYAGLFLQDSVDKQLHIAFDSGTITNEELHSENFELSESLCSEDTLRFGCCEASSIKFKISNIFTALKGKWLTVTLLHKGVNLSVVKDMLGHADESTTLKHYIFNIEEDEETDRIVLAALEGEKRSESDQSDQKIICFPRNKKAENPV